MILSLCLLLVVLCNSAYAAQAPSEYVFTGTISHAIQDYGPGFGETLGNTELVFSSPVFSFEQYAGYYVTVLYNGEYRTYVLPWGAASTTSIFIYGVLDDNVPEDTQYAEGSTVWIHQYPGNAGTGTSSNPIQISNVYQLQRMIDNMASHYVLINDINASITSTWSDGLGNGFMPIGNFDNRFTGTFNGNGYDINNLYVNRPDMSCVGMFGYVNGNGAWGGEPRIKNVGLWNPNITGYARVGALVGESNNYATLRECSITGADITGFDRVGGMIGSSQFTEIYNSYATGHVTSTSPSGDTGGLCGYMYYSNVVNAYAACGLTYNDADYAGGITGYADNTPYTSVYYDQTVSGVGAVGIGSPKTTAQMQTQSTFTGWDFADTWRMSGYPVLYGQVSGDFYLYPGNETILRNAPPLLHSVTIDMFRKGAASYDITIATDDLYTNVVYSANKLSSGGLANLTQTVSLEARTYYMQVEALDGSGNTLDTATSTFTISQTIDLGSTSVAGNIYEIISGVDTPISNVKVTLYNDTVSYDYITSSNGYYQFIGLANSTTYNMVAVKNGYEDSTLNVFTSVNGSTVTKNILMQKEEVPNYIMPHYVRFTVRSLLGGVYEGVLVTVYEGNSATPLFTQTTGSDGAVGFELSENIRYRLTLYSESDNINTVYRVTPTKGDYNIYVSLTSNNTNQADAGLILYGMHIDGNQLNVTWQDTSGLTSLVEVTIKNRDDSIAYYLNSTDSEGFLLQDVNTSENLTYIVELKVHSGGLDTTFIRTHILTFESGVRPAFDLGFSAPWQSAFLAALSLIFLAVIFGSGNAHVGAILVSLGGLFHIFVTGWIPASVLTVAMNFIAVIMSVFFYMRKSESIR